MPRVPRISAKDAVRAFEKVGYRKVRQTGSHIRMWPSDYPQRKPFVLPNHRIVKVGLLQRCIKDARMSIEEFIELL